MHTKRIFVALFSRRSAVSLSQCDQTDVCLFVCSFSLVHIELVWSKNDDTPIRTQCAPLAHNNEKKEKYVFYAICGIAFGHCIQWPKWQKVFRCFQCIPLSNWKMNANDILNVNVSWVCVCTRLSPTSGALCAWELGNSILCQFFSCPSVCLFVCLLYLSLRSHRSEANFTFGVFPILSLSLSLPPTPCVCVYCRLKFISFHWNGCHHKWIDFCRFVERIKNRFYAGFIMHWLYRLLRTFQCTSTRFLSASLSFSVFLSSAWLFVWFWRFHISGLYIPYACNVRTCVYLCVMCIYLFTFT